MLARALARRHPRFALGQLLHAELSAASALDGTLVGAGRAWSPALIDLLLEARARLDGASGGPLATRLDDGAASRPVVPPAPFVQIGRGVEHVVLVDLARSTLVLHAVSNGVSTPVSAHYVSSGSAGFGKRREGDRKTPLGLYRITRTVEDRALPELYGAGALVLDYPNAFDRRLGRTGSGIWLHGVPRARRSRAPRSSEGCVTMSNEHLVALGARLDPERTLVVLAASPGGTPGKAPDAVTHGRTPPPLSVAGRERARARARAHYRALFGDWRDARVRDGSAAAGLADVDVNDITILETTASGLPGTPDLVVMDLHPAAGGTATTLWWSRPAGAQHWTLVLEDIAPGGA